MNEEDDKYYAKNYSSILEKFLGIKLFIAEVLDPYKITYLKEKAFRIAELVGFDANDFFVYVHNFSVKMTSDENYFGAARALSERLRELEITFDVNPKQIKRSQIRFYNAQAQADLDIPMDVQEYYGDTKLIRIYSGTLLEKQKSFTTDLITYVDKSLRRQAHKKIKIRALGRPTDDFYKSIKRTEPLITKMDLYLDKDVSLLLRDLSAEEKIAIEHFLKKRARNGPVEQILKKYEGQRVKGDNDKQLEQFFVFNGKLHYLEVEAAQVLENNTLALQHLTAEEEIILTQAPKGGSYNALQMEDILSKLGIKPSDKTGSLTTQTKSSEAREEHSFKYDVFICHASEDKDSFVRPLAEELSFKGFNVWYDEFALKVGSSLRRSIEKGLIASRHGVVVLSPDFFKKEWPQKELDGLNALEDGVRTVILPIWHNVTKTDVLQYSPILADRVAINSSSGIKHAVSELLKVIRPKDKYEKLLEAAISKWLSHDILPSVEELYILSENINPEQLTRGQMAFLYCAFLVRDDEMFEWKEKGQPSFSFNYLKDHLFRQANIDKDILSTFHITANKAGMIGKEFLSMHGTALMEELGLSHMVLSFAILRDDQGEFPAIYLCLQDRDGKGLEILLVRKAVIRSFVRYMPKHSDESMRQIQLHIMDLI